MCHCHRGEFWAGPPGQHVPPLLLTSSLIPEGVGQRSLPWCLVAPGSPAGLMATEGVKQEPGGMPDLAAAPMKETKLRRQGDFG